MPQHDNGDAVAVSRAQGANGADGPHDSQLDHGAGEVATSAPDAAITTDSNSDADDESADQGGGTDIEKVRREAAKYRTRLRDMTAERDTLQDRLTNQQQAIIDRTCAAARLTDRHVTAAGIDLENMVDPGTGLLDVDRLSYAVEKARREFGVARPPAPNMQQSSGSGHHGQSAAAAFTEAFAPRRA